MKVINTGKNNRFLKRRGHIKKGSFFLDFLRKLDMLGIDINITYQMQYSFKTLFGAVLSILVAFIMMSFIGYKMHTWITRGDAKTSKQSFVQKLADTPPFYINKEGFKFAFSLANPISPELGSMKFNSLTSLSRMRPLMEE
jgi:hypothetical protein